jgi:hypothetical protein
MTDMLARPDSLIIWFALILCAVMDFTGTILLCLITVGIGWAGWYLSETIALIQDSEWSPQSASPHLAPAVWPRLGSADLA